MRQRVELTVTREVRAGLPWRRRLERRPVPHAHVLVYDSLGGATSTIYASETGLATIANPMIADRDGRVVFWADAPCEALVSGPGVVPYRQVVAA